MAKYNCMAGIVIALISVLQIDAFNRSLFYRSSSFWDEPRYDRDFLTTVDVQLQGGSNRCGHDSHGNKVNVGALFGIEKSKALSHALTQQPLQKKVHAISFRGSAEVFQSDINIYQNFVHGFFSHIHLPFMMLRFRPEGFVFSSSNGHINESLPLQPLTDPKLKLFLANFNLSLCPLKTTELSDSTIFFGWTHTFQETEYLDFADLTFKTGFLIPSEKPKNIDQVFYIPSGYNGHWAIPLSGDVSFGAYDWLTLGIHGDGLFFFNKKRCLRMKIPQEQSTGFITLGKGLAQVHHGIVWRLGAYIKADHFFHGLSCILGFSYEQKNRTHITPQDQNMFPAHTVNKSEQLKGWNRSIFHIVAEYDFAQDDGSWGPRIGLYYDHQVTGKRVFDVSMLGGVFGIDVNWCY